MGGPMCRTFLAPQFSLAGVSGLCALTGSFWKLPAGVGWGPRQIPEFLLSMPVEQFLLWAYGHAGDTVCLWVCLERWVWGRGYGVPYQWQLLCLEGGPDTC